MTTQDLPIAVDSLYRHATPVRYTEDGSTFFWLPERLPHENRDDNIIHLCNGSEYLWDIAQQYFGKSFFGGLSYIDIIAEFQPEPIIDRSITLEQGRVLLIPSIDYIEEVAKGPSLADEPVL